MTWKFRRDGVLPRWGSLRVAYNAFLAAIVVAFMNVTGREWHLGVVFNLGLHAIEANVWFFFGSMVSWILQRFGQDTAVSRMALFVTGSLLAGMLALWTLSNPMFWYDWRAK